MFIPILQQKTEAPILFTLAVKANQRFQFSVSIEVEAVKEPGKLTSAMFITDRVLSATPRLITWSHFISEAKASGTGVMAGQEKLLTDLRGFAHAGSLRPNVS